MGREIRRVPTDFDWPLNKIWGGFLRPEFLNEAPCEACGQTGTTPARQWVAQIANLLLMLDDDLADQQRGRAMHPYFSDTGSRAWGVRPSADIKEFGTGLAGREASFLGHDAIDSWRATDAVVRAAGLDPDVWGVCAVCCGHGSTETYETQRADAEAWRPTNPPTGDAWQLWETVSEGSPISPVFPERSGLVDWLCSPAYTFGISTPMQRDQAERFVDSGWAPSMIATAATGPVPGEQWVRSESEQR